jgi:hypothetical protein
VGKLAVSTAALEQGWRGTWRPWLPQWRPAVATLWDTAAMATSIEQAPPPVRAAAAAHAGDRSREHAEIGELLERHRAGEPGIVVDLATVLAALGNGADDGDPPRAAAV